MNNSKYYNNISSNVDKNDAIFFKDKSKHLSERIKSFEKYGDCKQYIFHPKNILLNRIFKIYIEQDYIQRDDIIECSSIIEWWLSELEMNRCHISTYLPTILKEKRNYKPSQEAIKRLEKYYYECLFTEGITRFKFNKYI